MLGKKWWMKTNLDRGSPNIFTESAMGEGCVCGGGGGAEEGGQVLKIAAKGHYKTMKDQVNLWTTLKYKK